jgi:hypothetical protein
MTIPSSEPRSISADVVHRLGLDPLDLDARAVVEAGVTKRLDDREVGVGQVDVLADHADPHRLGRRVDALENLSQLERDRSRTPDRRGEDRADVSSRPSACSRIGIS